MKSKTINKIIGILYVLIGLHTLFFSGGKYKLVVALLFFVNGSSSLLQDAESEFYRTLSKTLRRIALVIAISLIVKIFIIG